MPPRAVISLERLMKDERIAAPESTAVRVALWRALHVQLDPLPHVLEDELGLRLATTYEPREATRRERPRRWRGARAH